MISDVPGMSWSFAVIDEELARVGAKDGEWIIRGGRWEKGGEYTNRYYVELVRPGSDIVAFTDEEMRYDWASHQRLRRELRRFLRRTYRVRRRPAFSRYWYWIGVLVGAGTTMVVRITQELSAPLWG